MTPWWDLDCDRALTPEERREAAVVNAVCLMVCAVAVVLALVRW